MVRDRAPKALCVCNNSLGSVCDNPLGRGSARLRTAEKVVRRVGIDSDSDGFCKKARIPERFIVRS